MVSGRISEFLRLVNTSEKSAPPKFSIRKFGSVADSGSHSHFPPRLALRQFRGQAEIPDSTPKTGFWPFNGAGPRSRPQPLRSQNPVA
jgi:hypothetical protein